MVGIEAQQVTLTFEREGLSPGVSFEPLLNPNKAVFHLTRGYSLTRDTETIQHAWTATGMGPGQSRSGTPGDEELGFLQTQEVDTIQFFYAGQKHSHGSMTIDIGPSLATKTCLDSEDALEPWTSAKRAFVNGVWHAGTGDHPASRCPLRLGNTATNKPNFLFHVIDRRRYVTVLVFRLGTQFIPLRWFKWSVSHNVKFRWVGGQPQVHTNTSTFAFENVRVGSPDSATVSRIIQRPGRPFANYLTRTVLHGVVLGQLTGRTANKEWFVNVPADFWT